MKVLVIVASALLTMLVSIEASACGDSLYRVGQGVSYREYSAPLPGHVLIYAQSPSAGNLAEALARSGHQVRVVGDEFALNMEIRTSRYDVVIAPYREHAIVEKSVSDTNTTYLPVVSSEAESRTAKARYSKVMVADRDEVKHYLRAIHRVLEDKLS
jgi:hypothetical protein